ncbi:MAG: hypothetical protein SPI49_03550 [Eubacteriales bacterium]|nr:hypothetical protein [Eubacteriales bacterium]
MNNDFRSRNKELLEREYERTLKDISTLNDIEAEQRGKKLSKLVENMNALDDGERKNKEYLTRIGLETIGIVLPIIASSYWLGRAMKFEETGAFTSRASGWIGGITKIFRK